MIRYYDPQYYEYQALVFIARKFKTRVKANYKIPDYSLSWQSRNELDGLIEKDDKRIAVEIKSFPLNLKATQEISNKLSKLGFSEQIIVAPRFSDGCLRSNNVDLITFTPETRNISRFYRKWAPNIGGKIDKEIASGNHHFRYRLAGRNSQNQHRYLNQVDKKINSVSKISDELKSRIPRDNSVIKILWSVSSYINPKDLFFRKRAVFETKNELLVFDIDGQKTHGAFMSCELDPNTGLCSYCLHFSRLETTRLYKLLNNLECQTIGTYFSGRSGFHVYCLTGKKFDQKKLRSELFRLKIKNDNTVTFNQKSLVAFPESLNAISGYRLSKVADIDNFQPFKYV